MKKITTAVFVFLFGISVFAQTSDNTSEVKWYQGDTSLLNVFEPYNADYAIKGKIAGLGLPFLIIRSQVTESRDNWVETSEIQFPVLRNFSPEKVKQTTEIDLKTGLLKKITMEGQIITNNESAVGRKETSFIDGRLVSNGYVNQSNGKSKTKSNSFAVAEKLYPCQSNTFFSYLPLTENFIGSFTCMGEDMSSQMNQPTGYEGDSSYIDAKGFLKDDFLVTKMTVKAVGSETITTKAGTFDCYKIQQRLQILGKYDSKGKFKPANKDAEKSVTMEDEKLKKYYGFTWIDKRTRKLVKSEANFKNLAGLSVELLPQKNIDL
jgi:hypothetical protein